MKLPFTTEQFLSVFELYNRSVWPIQILLNLLALAAVILAIVRIGASDKIIAGILAFLWLWVGVAYHLVFFAPINPVARIFGLLNVLQAAAFVVYGIWRSALSFNYRTTVYEITGALFVVYALIIYPVLGSYLGHVYPKAPTFGLPCPTTIFTFGLLLWTRPKIPKIVLAIPFLWALIGFSAALALGMREDIGLGVAAIAGTALLIVRDVNIPGPQVNSGASR